MKRRDDTKNTTLYRKFRRSITRNTIITNRVKAFICPDNDIPCNGRILKLQKRSIMFSIHSLFLHLIYIRVSDLKSFFVANFYLKCRDAKGNK